MKRVAVILLMSMANIGWQAPVHAQDSSRKDLVAVELGTDRFAAGENVTVTKPIVGDLLAAGREILVQETVGGDVAAAGGSVRLDGAISNNTYAAGGQVFVNGTIARNARLAGGNVETATSSRVDGGVTVAAGQARMNGAIGGYLQAAGGSLYINGPVGGDVEAAAKQIELGPKARISGRLRYRAGATLKKDAGAQVLGGVEEIASGAHTARAFARGFGWALFLFWTLGLALLVAVLIVVLPGFAKVIATLEARPGMSALIGFVLLVCVPVASVILLITLIGAPLGMLSMVAYVALLFVGYLSAAAVVGDLLLKRLRFRNAGTAGWRIAAAICGIFVISFLGRIPALGGLIVFVALIMGMGAVGLQVNRTLRPAAH